MLISFIKQSVFYIGHSALLKSLKLHKTSTEGTFFFGNRIFTIYVAPTPYTCPHPRYGEIEFTDGGLVGADGEGNGGIVAHYTQVVWAKTTRVGCAVGKMGRDWDRGETKYL